MVDVAVITTEYLVYQRSENTGEAFFLPGGDERQNQHLQHPHQQFSREGEVDLSLCERETPVANSASIKVCPLKVYHPTK